MLCCSSGAAESILLRTEDGVDVWLKPAVENLVVELSRMTHKGDTSVSIKSGSTWLLGDWNNLRSTPLNGCH